MAYIPIMLMYVITIHGVLSELTGPTLDLTENQDLLYLLVEEKQLRKQLEGTVLQLELDVNFLKLQYQRIQSQYQQLIMEQNQTSYQGSSEASTDDQALFQPLVRDKQIRNQLEEILTQLKRGFSDIKSQYKQMLLNQNQTSATGANQNNSFPEVVASTNGIASCKELSITAGEITKIRLVGSPSPYMGRVEVFYNGTWGSVCDSEWDENDATVVCKMLGYGIGSPYSNAHFGQGTGKIWFENVQCDGSEISLSFCNHLRRGQTNCTHQMDVGVICGSIRISDGSDKFSGRVEIYHGGQWGTICNKDFDVKEARVVCSMLGLTGGTPYNTPGGRGVIWMDYLQCNGQEGSLKECPHNGWGINDCSHSDDVGVHCVNVRLVNGTASNKGRVEIFHNGQWGTICDDSWSNNDAHVVCKMLGYGNGTAYLDAHFGSGASTIWLDDVSCYGNESDIVHCQRSEWGNTNCQHKEDAGVSCDLDFKDVIRIVDGRNPRQGRVEIFHNGQWGTICDDVWDNNDAIVACRMAGYSGGSAQVEAYFGQGDGIIWLTNMECTGVENSLLECKHSPWNYGNCRHLEDAGVTCS